MTNTMEPELTVTGLESDQWTTVCELDRVTAERGVAALVDGEQIAIFRIDVATGTELYAVGHIDPRTGAPTMARGLVGSVGDEPTVAAPLLKEKYSLRTGECLSNPEYSLPVFEVRLHNDQVQVRMNVMPEKQA